MSIRFRIALLTISMLIPAIGGAIWMVASTYGRETEVRDASLRETSRALALVVDREIGRRESIARALAALPSLQDGDWKAFEPVARSAMIGIGGWVIVRDSRKQYVNTFLRAGAPIPEIRSQRLEVLATRPTLSSLALDDLSQRLLLTYNIPFRREGELFNLCVVMLPTELRRIISQQGLPQGWLAGVVDRDGVIVAREPDFDRWLGHPSTAEFRQKTATATAVQFSTMSVDGEETVAFASRTPGYDSTFSIAVPKRILNAGLRRSVFEVLVGSLLLISLGAYASLRLSRRIVNSIEALQASALALEQGRRPPPPRTGIRECDRVGEALTQAQDRMHAANELLEQRVAAAVSEVEQTHEKLAQSQKLEAIGRLTGGLAHDFNNLLQTLFTALQVLDRLTVDARARPMVEAGLRAVHKAKGLIQQMLAFGRRHALKPEAVDFRSQLLAMEMLLSKALPPNIVLKTDLAPNLWLLEADPAQLELALLNIVFNARDEMPGGGTITVRARNATATNEVVVEIIDDGPGIPAAILQRVFDPFFTTKPVGKGTGLGLSQVYAFASQSGGKAEVRSEPGAGATIALTLPRAAGVPAQNALDGTAFVPHRLFSVLFVEDDRLVAEVVGSALEGQHLAVFRAATGDEALTLLTNGTAPDVIFSDVVMPGSLSGVDLAEQVAARWPQIPVVLASGYSDRASAGRGVEILAKPYTIDAVIRALDKAVQRKRSSNDDERRIDLARPGLESTLEIDR